MCGIAGQYCFSGGEPDGQLLVAMSSRLSHRGPDGEGTRICGSTGLVHRRLAIIDLSADGLQPMTNEDGTLWLVFNGEIYNFIELREILEKKGHRFASHSDTEVILHAYEEWGVGCVDEFNGMWAFALWDDKQQRLFCARNGSGSSRSIIPRWTARSCSPRRSRPCLPTPVSENSRTTRRWARTSRGECSTIPIRRCLRGSSS